MADDEFIAVETYLRCSQYPKDDKGREGEFKTQVQILSPPRG